MKKTKATPEILLICTALIITGIILFVCGIMPQNNVNETVYNGSEAIFSQQFKVNINTASKEELMTLAGIGEKTAGDIISYRNETGGFSEIYDIKNVKGIGNKTFDNIKKYITV